MTHRQHRRVNDTSIQQSTRDLRAFTAIIGLAALVVLLQAVWAGIFIREHQDYSHTWIVVHARGADVAIGLGLVALVVLLLRARQRRDLVVGTAAFVVALVLEAYIGGILGPDPALSVVHFPLAMAITGLSVWLPFRASRDRS